MRIVVGAGVRVVFDESYGDASEVGEECGCVFGDVDVVEVVVVD